MRSQPYSASSTLLFALVPGQRRSAIIRSCSARALAESGETSAEQATRECGRDEAPRPDRRLLGRRVPDVGRDARARAYRAGRGRSASWSGPGEPLALVERAQHGVARAFALAGLLDAGDRAGRVVSRRRAGDRAAAADGRGGHARRRRRARAADGGDRRPGAGRRCRSSPSRSTTCSIVSRRRSHGQREFVADASHELRTPLTVIRGQLEVLAAQPDPSGSRGPAGRATRAGRDHADQPARR